MENTGETIRLPTSFFQLDDGLLRAEPTGEPDEAELFSTAKLKRNLASVLSLPNVLQPVSAEVSDTTRSETSNQDYTAYLAQASVEQQFSGALEQLRDIALTNPDILYAVACDLADAAEDLGEVGQDLLGTALLDLRPKRAAVLLNALSDREVELSAASMQIPLTRTLNSESKRLAQAAAACLLVCVPGGRRILADVLRRLKPPHEKLVQNLLRLA